RPQVLLANRRAASLGIRPGMPLAAAHALGELGVLERDVAAEQRMLARLCRWALQFTAELSPVAPDGLVLEVAGSLKLFDGLEGLLRRLRGGLRQLGFRVDYAVAPTPLAAALLARARPREIVRDIALLPDCLARLPLAALRLAPAEHDALVQLGVRRIDDCRRLPRAGLARRLSPRLLDHLDRLFGQVPDPRPHFESPRCFESDIELPWEVDNARVLLAAGERLLHELIGCLRGSNTLVQQMEWGLVDRDGRRETFPLGLAEPSRDEQHMLLLLREIFMRKRLAVPVRLIGLRVKTLIAERAPRTRDLFTMHRQGHTEDYAGFVDRMRARCGESALRGLDVCAQHRPEAAFGWRRPLPGADRMSAVNGVDGNGPAGQRPLWLLEQPLRLAVREGQPWFEGPLTLVPGRERIQNGWWDERAVMRDYFVATTLRGGRLWVFRELDGARRWFLHGIFE
ncbi:MAG: DNA polymerase Y family protein, partial [Gammaproteobacteria bacterium]